MAPHIWEDHLCRPPPVKIDRRNAREREKSAININQPRWFIAPVIMPFMSITANKTKVVSIPYDTSLRTSGIPVFLASQVITARPSAQAPKNRVFIIPVRFVSRPRSDRLKTGASIKRTPFRNERKAAIEVTVLYFMACVLLSH
jgi:hypothetical protein